MSEPFTPKAAAPRRPPCSSLLLDGHKLFPQPPFPVACPSCAYALLNFRMATRQDTINVFFPSFLHPLRHARPLPIHSFRTRTHPCSPHCFWGTPPTPAWGCAEHDYYITHATVVYRRRRRVPALGVLPPLSRPSSGASPKRKEGIRLLFGVPDVDSRPPALPKPGGGSRAKTRRRPSMSSD